MSESDYHDYDWQHGLCSCFDDCGLCLVSYFCPCYTVGVDAEAVGENCCLCGFAVLTPAVWFTVPLIRGYIRDRQHIPGSYCEDCCVFFWCPCCTLAQMHQETYEFSSHSMARE